MSWSGLVDREVWRRERHLHDRRLYQQVYLFSPFIPFHLAVSSCCSSSIPSYCSRTQVCGKLLNNRSCSKSSISYLLFLMERRKEGTRLELNQDQVSAHLILPQKLFAHHPSFWDDDDSRKKNEKCYPHLHQRTNHPSILFSSSFSPSNSSSFYSALSTRYTHTWFSHH